MKVAIDFASQEFFRDPAAGMKRLHAAGPVVEVRFPIVGRVFMTTTQEMAARVLKDGRAFTLRKDDGTLAGLRWWMPRIFRVFANSMLNMDEPDHARLRGLVDEAFRRRAVLDMEHGAAAKGLVDEAAQTRVVRFVHVEHAVGEHAEYARHPPAQSGKRAVVLAQGEHAAVLEHARPHLLRGGHEHPADDRKAHLDHRPGGLQPPDAGGGIAKEILAREIDSDFHGNPRSSRGSAGDRL